MLIKMFWNFEVPASSVTLRMAMTRGVAFGAYSDDLKILFLPSSLRFRCCCFPTRKKKRDRALVVEDNCCYCNYAALRYMVDNHNMEVVYVTYHVDVSAVSVNLLHEPNAFITKCLGLRKSLST